MENIFQTTWGQEARDLFLWSLYKYVLSPPGLEDGEPFFCSSLRTLLEQELIARTLKCCGPESVSPHRGSWGPPWAPSLPGMQLLLTPGAKPRLGGRVSRRLS